MKLTIESAIPLILIVVKYYSPLVECGINSRRPVKKLRNRNVIGEGAVVEPNVSQISSNRPFRIQQEILPSGRNKYVNFEVFDSSFFDSANDLKPAEIAEVADKLWGAFVDLKIILEEEEISSLSVQKRDTISNKIVSALKEISSILSHFKEQEGRDNEVTTYNDKLQGYISELRDWSQVYKSIISEFKSNTRISLAADIGQAGSNESRRNTRWGNTIGTEPVEIKNARGSTIGEGFRADLPETTEDLSRSTVEAQQADSESDETEDEDSWLDEESVASHPGPPASGLLSVSGFDPDDSEIPTSLPEREQSIIPETMVVKSDFSDADIEEESEQEKREVLPPLRAPDSSEPREFGTNPTRDILGNDVPLNVGTVQVESRFPDGITEGEGRAAEPAREVASQEIDPEESIITLNNQHPTAVDILPEPYIYTAPNIISNDSKKEENILQNDPTDNRLLKPFEGSGDTSSGAVILETEQVNTNTSADSSHADRPEETLLEHSKLPPPENTDRRESIADGDVLFRGRNVDEHKNKSLPDDKKKTEETVPPPKLQAKTEYKSKTKSSKSFRLDHRISPIVCIVLFSLELMYP